MSRLKSAVAHSSRALLITFSLFVLFQLENDREDNFHLILLHIFALVHGIIDTFRNHFSPLFDDLAALVRTLVAAASLVLLNVELLQDFSQANLYLLERLITILVPVAVEMMFTPSNERTINSSLVFGACSFALQTFEMDTSTACAMIIWKGILTVLPIGLKRLNLDPNICFNIALVIFCLLKTYCACRVKPTKI